MNPCHNDGNDGSDDFLPADVQTPFHLWIKGHIPRFCLFATLYSNLYFKVYQENGGEEVM